MVDHNNSSHEQGSYTLAYSNLMVHNLRTKWVGDRCELPNIVPVALLVLLL